MYHETGEPEMNMWISLTGARNLQQRRTLILFTVTIIRRDCDERHKEFRQCAPATEVKMSNWDYVYLMRHYFQCIPSDLFCDGTVNCALLTGKPLGRD